LAVSSFFVVICGGGFGGLWMKIGYFLLFFVVFCALWRYGVVWGSLGFWNGLLRVTGFLVDKFFCRALMTPLYLVPDMRFCSGKFGCFF